MKILSIIPLTLLILSCQTQEQTVEKDPFEIEIDSIVQLQKESWDVPGLAVGIIKNNEIVYSNAFGVQSLDENVPLTTQSVFHMASVSKPFVATAIMQLVEQGKIDLNAKLIDYLPYFKMADSNYQNITILQMLRHTSGIHDVEDYEWDKPQLDDGAAERYTRSFVNDQLDFEPGSNFSYSNSAFDILADVISKVSGLTFEEYMEQNIFQPIGMKNSTFYKPEVPKEIATKAHVFGKNLQISVSDIYPYNRIHAPSSTLNSNVDDLLRWALVNLNKGTIDGNTIYGPLSYEVLTTPALPSWGEDSVCLSWFQGLIGDHKIIKHSGGDTGFSTFFMFSPKTQSALVMMANNDAFWSGDASRILMEKILLGEVTKKWEVPIYMKLKNYILAEGIEKCKEIYEAEKANNPDGYIYDNWTLDDFGYALLDFGYHEQALEVFLWNVELQPEDAGWYDSVADAYITMGNTELAVEWYKKALAINPEQQFTIDKLAEIEKEM